MISRPTCPTETKRRGFTPDKKQENKEISRTKLKIKHIIEVLFLLFID